MLSLLHESDKFHFTSKFINFPYSSDGKVISSLMELSVMSRTSTIGRFSTLNNIYSTSSYRKNQRVTHESQFNQYIIRYQLIPDFHFPFLLLHFLPHPFLLHFLLYSFLLCLVLFQRPFLLYSFHLLYYIQYSVVHLVVHRPKYFLNQIAYHPKGYTVPFRYRIDLRHGQLDYLFFLQFLADNF